MALPARTFQPPPRADSSAGSERSPEDLALGRPASASSFSISFPASCALDGDPSTRWGSACPLADADGQWIAVDLGEQCWLDRVEIRWTAAYAVSYLLQGSLEREPSSWATLATETGHEGWVVTQLPVGSKACWLRMLGKCRSTNFGLSIWELRILGGRDVPAVIGETSNGAGRGGERGSLSLLGGAAAGALSLLGGAAARAAAGALSSRGGAAAGAAAGAGAPPTDSGTVLSPEVLCINHKGCIRPPGHRGDCVNNDLDVITVPPRPGLYQGTAKHANFTGDGMTYLIELSRTGECIIEYTPNLSFLEGGSPSRRHSGRWRFDGGRSVVVLLKSEELHITVGPHGNALTLENVECKWQRELAGEAAPGPGADEALDRESHERSDTPRQDLAETEAEPPEEIRHASRDMARGRPTRASSWKSEERAPSRAVDGQPSTRWTSAYEDDQWIAVDLGEKCWLDRVEIRWEVAHAASYVLQGSLEKEPRQWVVLAAEVGREGWVATPLPAGRKARWVRMLGRHRATRFGFSIWEFRVFGGPAVPVPAQIHAGPSAAAREVAAAGALQSAKVAILARGSRGDIQPCVALALRLKDQGCTVKMICNDGFGPVSQGRADFIRGHADFIRSLALDVETFPWDQDGATGMRQCFIYDRVKAFQPDLLLYCLTLALEAWAIEEQLGIPTVEYSLGVLPSRDLATHVMQKGLSGVPKHCLDRHIGTVTLEDVRGVQDVCRRMWSRSRLSLYACSHHVVNRPPEWPTPSNTAGVHLTGYWFLDLRTQTRLVESGNAFLGAGQYQQLRAFLDAGQPPVYVGWGSTGGDFHESTFLGLLAVRTLHLAGKRGVVLGSYRDLGPSSLAGAEDAPTLTAFASRNVFWAKWVPHEWLLPRCCAIVIHGGCNTTAAALRAGKPTVVTPVAWDQFFWADQVVSKGVGVRTGQLATVTPSDLAHKLRQCESDTMARACKDLSEKLMSEDGVGYAVEMLGSYYEKATRGLVSLTGQTAD